jgi:hypothetical protein
VYIGGVIYDNSVTNLNILNSAIMIPSDPIINRPTGCMSGFVAFDWPFYFFIVIFIGTFILMSLYIYKKMIKKESLVKRRKCLLSD